jgi:hypothetical protein
MSVKWLIEDGIFEDNIDSIKDALSSQNIECKFCRYFPFDDNSTFLNLFKEDDCVVVYGSLQFAAKVKRNARWVPGVYGSLNKYECLYYYPRFHRYLLNEDYAMLPYGDLLNKKSWILESFGISNSVFVRPSGGSKSFTGTVINSETWVRDVEKLGFYDVSPETLVVVSSPKNIKNEWRLVIGEGRIIAYSQYKSEVGAKYATEISDDALIFAHDVLRETEFSPDPVWILDICETKDGIPKVLEIGVFSCAGLYACDKNEVVREVSAIALKEWTEYKEIENQ